MSNKKICGDCRYLGPLSTYPWSRGEHECHANPPTVFEEEAGTFSRYSTVNCNALACRFFVEGGV